MRRATGKVPNDTWIMFAVLTAILAVFVLGIYLPQSRQMGTLQNQITKDREDIARDAGAVAVVPSLVRRVHELQVQYKDFDRRLPKEVDVGAFYRDVSASFTEEKLARPYMAIQSPVREELYTTLPIRLQTEGSYLAVGKLLERLNSMERLTLVEKLEMKALPKSSSVEVSMLVNIYHTPGAAETGKDEQRKQ
ncbi:MAG: type 4a pilus biogenesis protein PilO [Planctomycetota bacterium]